MFNELYGYAFKKDNFQLNLFPIRIFAMWYESTLLIDFTFLFITIGIKINLFDSTF